jgi:L-threonate 2-dehydrogenase
VAERADVLLSILPDAAAVEEVVCGEAGTLTKLRAGTVHIEMSTVDVGHKGRIRDAVRRCGGDLLDCPISGSPGMVSPRLATTFASGDQASIDSVRPVLDAISGPWVYTGAFGTGARMKYIASMLLATHTVAAAEAMVLARRSGLDLELVQRTLGNSIAASAIWKQRGPLMQQRAWLPAPGPIDMLHSILEQIEDYAAAAGLQTPVFTSAKAVFDKAVADGWGELDIACVHDQISGDSALTRGTSS